jgi:hypothetical protein
MARAEGIYRKIINHIFAGRYTAGDHDVPFDRVAVSGAALELGVQVPKNLGDVIYRYRFRAELPPEIRAKAPADREWVIRLAGIGKYRFSAVKERWLLPDLSLAPVKIPDATPQLLQHAALVDEQALLARVRYNRLIDLVLGVSAHSLQNHLRTTAEGIGQTEIDEVYAAVDGQGAQYIIPVQAKGGRDKIGIVQVEQDVYVCREKWPSYAIRPIAAQFLPGGDIALFELALGEDALVKVKESRYRLVAAGDISDEDRRAYADSSGVEQMTAQKWKAITA